MSVKDVKKCNTCQGSIKILTKIQNLFISKKFNFIYNYYGLVYFKIPNILNFKLKPSYN